jgi:putative membrane protein
MKGFSELIVAVFTLGVLPSAPSADTADRKFAKEAAVDNIAEVELATLAQEKASSDQVRQYAARLRRDHQQANEKLKALASQKGVPLPSEMDAKHKREKDRLTKMKASDFDRAYIDTMVKEHKEDVREFEKEAEKGKDADLKAFAAETLPTLREHLQQAEQLQTTVKAEKKSRS